MSKFVGQSRSLNLSKKEITFIQKRAYVPLLVVAFAEILALTIAFFPDPNEPEEVSDSVRAIAVRGIPSIAIAIAGAITLIVQLSLKDTADKNERLRKHYQDDIRPVLEQWKGCSVYPAVFMDGQRCSEACIFATVADDIRKADRFNNEVTSHLRTGFKNERILALFNQLENAENEHNRKALAFNTRLEAIRDTISTITDLRPFNRETQRDKYFNYGSIIRYITESADNKLDKDEHLSITPYGNHPKLRHRQIDDVAVGDENDLKHLIAYLESEEMSSIISQMRELRNNVNRISELKKEFDCEIDTVIHELDRSDLPGSCTVEEKLNRKHFIWRKRSE